MSFNIGEIHPNTPHLLADLAELLILVGHIGRPHLHKNDLESLLNDGVISSEELDDEEQAQRDAEERRLPSAERVNRLEKQLEDVLSQFGYRSKAISDYYPFTVANEHIEVKDQLTEKHRIYRLLLSCSRLRSFNRKGLPQKWAKHFSEVSKSAMKALMPPYAETRIFDANSQDRREYYSTDLRQALRALGTDLGVLQVNESECDKAGSSGDAGYDLVSVLPFNDGASVNYAILGQCGAQEKNWPTKRLEAHSLNLRNYYSIQFDYPSIMFTPLCYRSATGEWVDNSTTNGIMVADRVRILNLLEMTDSWTCVVSRQWFSEFETEFNEIRQEILR